MHNFGQLFDYLSGFCAFEWTLLGGSAMCDVVWGLGVDWLHQNDIPTSWQLALSAVSSSRELVTAPSGLLYMTPPCDLNFSQNIGVETPKGTSQKSVFQEGETNLLSPFKGPLLVQPRFCNCPRTSPQSRLGVRDKIGISMRDLRRKKCVAIFYPVWIFKGT